MTPCVDLGATNSEYMAWTLTVTMESVRGTHAIWVGKCMQHLQWQPCHADVRSILSHWPQCLAKVVVHVRCHLVPRKRVPAPHCTDPRACTKCKLAMASSKHAKTWKEQQKDRVLSRSSDISVGPRSKAVWEDARHTLRCGMGSWMKALRTDQDPFRDVGSASSASGAASLQPALQDLQEACRRTARESLSTTATVLDPLQFTRVVRGRPIQVRSALVWFFAVPLPMFPTTNKPQSL